MVTMLTSTPQLFVYFSLGKCSETCVRPALEMDASKKEQRCGPLFGG